MRWVGPFSLAAVMILAAACGQKTTTATSTAPNNAPIGPTSAFTPAAPSPSKVLGPGDAGKSATLTQGEVFELRAPVPDSDPRPWRLAREDGDAAFDEVTVPTLVTGDAGERELAFRFRAKSAGKANIVLERGDEFPATASDQMSFPLEVH